MKPSAYFFVLQLTLINIDNVEGSLHITPSILI